VTSRGASALLLVALVACGRTDRRAQPAPAADPVAGAAPAEGETAAPLAKSTVTLYFPSAAGDTLTTESREILDTIRPAERGTQVLAELLEGPREKGALAAVPEGTTLRRLWVREDGTAFADFSDELASGLPGGSSDEILAIYAIVDSLTANVPEIQRVGILVAGRERDTLGGHVDLRRPLRPDMALAQKKAE